MTDLKRLKPYLICYTSVWLTMSPPTFASITDAPPEPATPGCSFPTEEEKKDVVQKYGGGCSPEMNSEYTGVSWTREFLTLGTDAGLEKLNQNLDGGVQ